MGFTTVISWLLLSFQVVPAERLDPAAAVRLATELRNEKKLGQAEATLLKVLATATESGQEGLEAALILNELGLVYHDLDRYAKAEGCYKRSLQVWERICGPEGACLIPPLFNLAAHYLYYGQLTKADRLGRRLERIRLAEPGPEDSDRPALLRVLAVIHYARGRYSQAEPLFRQALSLRKRTARDADSGGLAATLNGLAVVCARQGRYSEALPHLGQAVEIWKETSDHRNLARGLKNLAVFHARIGRRAEAEALFRQTLALAESTYEPTHPFMEEVLSEYAVLLRQAHRKAEAKELEKRASTIREKHPPRDGQYVIDINALRPEKRK